MRHLRTIFILNKNSLHIKAFIHIFYLLLLLSMASCEKEKTHPGPDIEIFQPSSMMVYGLGDTIPVHVIIRHHIKIDFVSLSLESETGFPYEPSRQFDVDSAYFELKSYIIIQNTLIKGGANYVQISIHDEKHHSSAFFLPVNIAEVPRQLKSAVFLVKQLNQTIKVQSLTPSGIIDDLFQPGGSETGDIALSSHNQLMYYVDGRGQRLSAFDLVARERIWTLFEGENPVQWPFQSLYSDDTTAYVFKAQGFINGYNNNQMVVFRTGKFEHGTFTHITRFGRLIAASFKPFNTGLTRLYLFNSPGGTVFREVSFNGEVLYLSAYDKNRLILFLRVDNKIKLYHYDIELNTLVFSMELPFGEAKEITGRGKDNYFVIHQDELWWVRPEINSAVNYLEHSSLHNVAYDALGNYLFVAAGTQLSIYHLPQVVPFFEHSTGGEVSGLELLYNR